MSKTLNAVLGVAALTFGVAASAAPVHVDTFNTLQALITDDVNAGTGVSASQAGAGMLGGERDLWANAITGAGGAGSGYGTRIGVITPGYLTFSNDSGVQGLGRVQWDGVDNSNALNTTGLGGYDLTIGGTAAGFTVTTISSDANWNFEVFIYTDANNWTQISFPATSVPSGTGPVTSFIPFSAFETPGLCGTTGAGGTNFINCGAGSATADVSNVGAIDLWLNTAAGASPIAFDIDLRLDSISIPAPGTLALFGIGMVVAGFAAGGARKHA